MALLGKAAVVIWCEIDAAIIAEHDVWHSSEHLPERMDVPGFLRGRRAAALDSAARQQRFVLYEIEDIAVSTSAPYLERLNKPTPWSKKVMAQCRLSRTLCRVAASHGAGLGGYLVTARLGARSLDNPSVAELARRPGVVGVHLLERDASVSRPRTHEESLRRGGADEAVERVLIVEGFDGAALAQLLSREGLAAEPYILSHLMSANA